jgi:hypothetical protein
MTVAKLAKLEPSLGVSGPQLVPYRRVWLECSVRSCSPPLVRYPTDCMYSDTVPGMNNILSMIHNRRRRDTYIIGGLIGVCLFFLLRYIFW